LVTATHSGRYGNFLDDFGENLAAFCVSSALFVFYR
jgi:hypothetical protein